MNKENIDMINREIEMLYHEYELSPVLGESMRYSLQAGGKRIRPLLLLSVLEALNIDIKKGLPVCTAIEMIHTYSLIHDDLPAMDDDDYRRGKLTNHKVYGEDVAILAGDGMLTDSFLHIINCNETSDIKLKLLALLTKAAGTSGMVGGQMLDMANEKKTVDLQTLEQIHAHKTGALINASVVAGGIIGEMEETSLKKLNQIGWNIGLMFQIKDDLLDVEGSFEMMGKTAGSDLANEKSTYVSLLGLNETKERLEALRSETQKLIEEIFPNGSALKELVNYVVNRNK